MAKEINLFDQPQNVRRLLLAFYVSLGILLVVDFFIPKHPDFAWEAAPNFFAAYGFVSCVLLIFIAKILRRFIKRSEDHYERKTGSPNAPDRSSG